MVKIHKIYIENTEAVGVCPTAGTDLILEAAGGANLYRVLSEAGLVEGPCGGKGVCGKCGVLVGSEPTLSCTYYLEQDVTVTLPQKTELGDIVAQGYTKKFMRKQAEPGELGMAVDIGTTTVVAALVDLCTGEELAVLSCLNTQKVFGQDVISRIHYASEHSGALAMLQERIRSDIRQLMCGLAEKTGTSAQSVKEVVVAGNTTMIHLLAGVDPKSLGRSPYEPAFSGPLTLQAAELGLCAANGAEVYCIPAVSAFVGGDITSGILVCDLAAHSGNALFLDIGTNGELVLQKGDQLFCCSCAAGPALEGMNISCGMRAAEGAIEDIWFENNRVEYRTIGGKPAVGICGSGILAAVAELRRAGIISDSGRFSTHPLVESDGGKKRFVIDREGQIVLSQKDVRQVQLAKAAILSGIYALMEAAEIGEDELSEVLVAGQFGAHLEADRLIGSGILPESWGNRIRYVGNTSKSGAYMCLLSPEERRKAEGLAERLQYIELSRLEGYEALFVKCLNFQ